MMAIKSSGLLDTQQAAEILGCTLKHVRYLVTEGKLEAYCIGKRQYRISRESAFKLLEEQKES